MHQHTYLVTALFLMAAILSGCEDGEKPYIERPVHTLFEEGYKNFQDERYKDAADSFDEIERQHPYCAWAGKAQLMSAYSSYKEQKFLRAIGTLDVFIAIHPSHPMIDYAYYLRALCCYTDMQSITYDKSNAEDALKAFDAVVKRFPSSDYAQDSRFKIKFIKEYLASHEMETARLFLNRRDYLPAQMRFSGIVKEYPESIFVEEALYRMVECQLAMGFRNGAKKAARMLSHNFPRGEWYKRAYNLLK